MNIEEIVTYIHDSIYVINLMTILGSVLSFIIFSRKSFKKSTIGIYCKSLAIFDLSEVFNLVVGIASITRNNNRSLILDTKWACKMMAYICAVFSTMSGWILVFFSLDQLVTISMTRRFHFYKKTWLQYTIIFGLFVFHCTIYIPMIFKFSVVYVTNIENENMSTCGTSSIVFPIIIFAEASLIPLIILSILTAIIVKYLAKSRRRVNINLRSKTSNEQQVSNAASSSSLSATVISSNRRLKEFKYAFNSVILNIIHILFLMPLLIFTATLSISSLSIDNFLLFNAIAYAFGSLSTALHFWVYFCVNSIFRKEFFILIRSFKIK